MKLAVHVHIINISNTFEFFFPIFKIFYDKLTFYDIFGVGLFYGVIIRPKILSVFHLSDPDETCYACLLH